MSLLLEAQKLAKYNIKRNYNQDDYELVREYLRGELNFKQVSGVTKTKGSHTYGYMIGAIKWAVVNGKVKFE